MSTLATNAITDASGGNTATINGQTPTESNMAGRNRIINGDMRIDQRNGGASVTNNVSNAQYSVDRWKFLGSVSAKFTAQQNAGSVTPPLGFTNYLGVTSLSAYTVGAGDYFAINHEIEGFNVADLGFGTVSASSVTISFWVYSSLTGTFGAALTNASTRGYPFTYTISSANTWEKKIVSIAGDTTGTWNVGNSYGLRLKLGLGVGSTYSGTAGSWVSDNLISATGATSVVGTSGATFYITGVQLEAGSVATPFERRQYGQELALCQRYCEGFGLSGSGADKDLCMGAGNGNAGNFQAFFPWKVQKRAAPTVSLAAASNFYVHVPGAFRVTCTSLSATDPTETGTHLAGVSSSGSFSSGQACFLAAIPTTALVIASAEL